jgi:hypothetical protein
MKDFALCFILSRVLSVLIGLSTWLPKDSSFRASCCCGVRRFRLRVRIFLLPGRALQLVGLLPGVRGVDSRPRLLLTILVAEISVRVLFLPLEIAAPFSHRFDFRTRVLLLFSQLCFLLVCIDVLSHCRWSCLHYDFPAP